jgi:tetratricopeptide (TPR) repeat protein
LEASQDRIASEYVESQQRPPDPLLRKGTFVDGVLNLGVQLAEALAFIHSLGICHSDLKPSNVLMRPDGRPMLLDFNLSFRERPVASRLGGTFPYMSPEFLRAMDPDRKGFPIQLDARSDVFSLGVVLSELLTGHHPFGPLEKIDNYENLRQRLLEEQEKGVRVAWSKNPRVDPRIRRLLDQCVAFRPEDRPQTANELARGLRKSLSRRQRFRRWARLNTRLLVESVALSMAVLGLVIYWSVPKGPYSVRQFKKGMELYNARQFDEASEYFTRAVRSNPHDPDAHFARGRALQHMNLFAPAQEAYLEAEKLRPQARLVACMAYCSAQLGNHTNAIAEDNSAIEQGYETAEVLNNRGYSLLQRQLRLEDAELDFIAAIKLRDSLQAPHYNLAWLHLVRAYREKDPQTSCVKGCEHIRRALEIGPERADLHYTGAKLCARAAENEKSFIEPAFVFLSNAIRLGLPPKQLEVDAAGFKALAELARFKQLAATAPMQFKPEATPRLVDPLQDE